VLPLANARKISNHDYSKVFPHSEDDLRVESAITRSCAETELTREQVLMPEPPRLIEEARAHLHPKSRVDRAIETGVLRRLRQAWVGACPSLENDDLH
jgi:hypothetical protein